MTDLLEEIKQLQGLEEEKKKRNILPRAILVVATVALVVVMIIRFQHKYEQTERSEVSHLQPAVLIQKFSDSTGPVEAAVRAEDPKQRAAGRPEALPEAAAAAGPGGGAGRQDAVSAEPSEQADLEQAIDMLMKRRSPKY